MQPMYRPPMPPQGMRPPGAPPQGPPPSGLPPPQRPPTGYKPTIPAGYAPPAGPPSSAPPAGLMGNAVVDPHTMKPHFNPPIQKMADMSLVKNSVATTQQISQLSMNSDQHSISNSVNPSNEAPRQSHFPDSTTTAPPTSNDATAPLDSLQQRFQRDSPLGEAFPSSLQSSILNNQEVPPSSIAKTNHTVPSEPSPNLNSMQNIPLSTHSPFGAGPRPTAAPIGMPPMQPAQPPTNSTHSSASVGAMNRHFSQMQPGGAPPNAPQMMPSQPGMNIPRPGMSSPGSHFSSTQPMMTSSTVGGPGRMPVPPSTSGHGSMMPPSISQSGPMMPPSISQSGPAIPPSSAAGVGAMVPPSVRGPGPVMPPFSSGSSTGPMMPPLPTGAPPRPMMPPTSTFSGMPPTSSSMAPPRPGMQHAPTPPMGQSGNTMFHPPSPASHMMPSQPGTQSQRPGMPPPPTSSYMPSPTSSAHSQPGTQSGMPPLPGTQSGMPPLPGGMGQTSPSAIGGMQNRYPGAAPGAGSMGGYQQGSQGRMLNLDDMPSPLQVIEDDKHSKSGEFLTSLKGTVPPLVTTDFVVRDGGNASPRFIRSTVYSVAATPDMMKQTSVPFGLVISPLADPNPSETPLYLGTSLANGPIRCNRCKAYMSPFMMFMDGGRRFQCLLCKQISEVPADYYCHMDGQGCRADKYQRPELCFGSYEFIATPEYCKDKLLPKEPAFIFVLEMSQMMVQRGIINLICQNMKSLLGNLPCDEVSGQKPTRSSVRVGFITYDSSVHFYKLTGLAPEMCIVCDKEDMFVPVPDGVLCDVEQVADNIDKLMDSIPQNFQTTRETSGALLCALQAGMSALKASGRAGKLFVFHSSLAQVEGLGKLRNREDRKVLGTEKEKVVLSPQNNHYNNLAQELVSVGCGVDLYIFNESYVDLATIGQVCRLTGGQCHKYTFFQPNKDSERLLDDLRINIGRNIAFDSVMRVRTSTGVRPVDFFGHFFMSNTQDIELAVVDSSKAVVVEVKHDDKITEEDGVYIQVALLYTSSGGQRRLRIINLGLNICSQKADLFKNCDLDTLMNFFGKHSIFKFLDTSAKQVKENLIARTAQILACYRKDCATPSSAGQLILPEMMKLLPLYINCLSKCDALSGGQDLTCDDRSWHMYQLSTMPLEASVIYYYPRLIPLCDDDQPQSHEIPSPVRTSYEKLSPDGAYLLENGLFMFLWVGSGTSSMWMKDVFGVSAPHQLDPVLAELPELDTGASKRVRGIINAVRTQRKFHVRLFVVPQQGKHEIVMRNYLVEDKGLFSAPSYIDFLCHIHKEIRALMS